jgi:phage minor structural protein
LRGQSVIHITDQQSDYILDFIAEDSYWDDERKRSLVNQLDTFDFTTYADQSFAQHLTKRNRLVIPNRNGTLSEYIIEENEQTGERQKTVFCSASYIELSKTRWISPVTTGELSTEQHVTSALLGTEWTAKDIPFIGTRSFVFDQYTDALTYLRRIAESFELELNFRVEHNGTRVTKRYVEFVERIGQWNGYEASFGRDITAIKRIEKTDDVVTKLIVIGEATGGNPPLTVEVTSADGLSRWGREDVHLTDIFKPETDGVTVSEARLREIGQAELDRRLNGHVSYEISIINLTDILGIAPLELGLGDSIRVKDEGFTPALYVDARVRTITGSIKEGEVETVELGDFIEYTADQIFAFFNAMRAELAEKVAVADMPAYLEDIGGTTIVRSVTAPTDTTVYWLDTSVYPNILKSWDGYEWVKASPTEAGEIGAETPAGALDKARVEALRVELRAMNATYSNAEGLNAQYSTSSYLTQAQKDLLAADYNGFYGAHVSLQDAITAAIADDLVTGAELGSLATLRGAYITKLNTFIMTASSLGEDIRDNIVDQSETFVQSYANKKIFNGATAPASPGLNDLWIDTSVTPYVWKNWNGSTWVKAIPTNLQDLAGKITSVQITDGAIQAPQIAANVIVSNMIAAVGIDAGVIKFGTMSGDRILANTIDANRLKANTVIANNITFTGVLSGATGTFSGKVEAGSITSNTSINVTTNITVGNRISLGSQASDGVVKSIYFNDAANISGGGGAYGADIEMNANYTNFIGTGVSFANVGTVNFGGAAVNGLSGASVGYATTAGNASQLGGNSASAFSLSGHTHPDTQYVIPYTGQNLRLWRNGTKIRVYQGTAWTELTGVVG